MFKRKPGGSAFCWVLAFSTTSCHQRVSKTTGVPEGPFGREWLSLPHLISIFSGPQLIRRPRGPLRPDVAFPTTSRLLLQLSSRLLVLTELYNSSTPTQSPTQSLEWHVCHQAEITHAVQRSLSSGASVYECIMGFFTLSHFVSQFLPSQFLSITGHWDVSLPSGASPWNGKFSRVEGQNTTIIVF